MRGQGPALIRIALKEWILSPRVSFVLDYAVGSTGLTHPGYRTCKRDDRNEEGGRDTCQQTCLENNQPFWGSSFEPPGKAWQASIFSSILTFEKRGFLPFAWVWMMSVCFHWHLFLSPGWVSKQHHPLPISAGYNHCSLTAFVVAYFFL